MNITTANEQVACEPFPTPKGVMARGTEGTLGFAADVTELTALKVVFPSTKFKTGDLIYVKNSDRLNTTWGKTNLSVKNADGTKTSIIIVPHDQILLYERT